jgi:hypothetical protein
MLATSFKYVKLASWPALIAQLDLINHIFLKNAMLALYFLYPS